jgi:hypothetical protein
MSSIASAVAAFVVGGLLAAGASFGLVSASTPSANEASATDAVVSYN